MKRILMIALFLMACVLIVANSAWPIPPSPPKAAGAGEGDMTKATYDADENSKIDANKVDDLSATYQVALSLLKGTYTNTYLCKYTATGTLLDCNVDPAGFQAADSDLSTFAGITPSADMQAFLAAADDAAALTELGAVGVSGEVTDEQLACWETSGSTNLIKSCGAKTTYTEPAANTLLMATSTGNTGGSGLIKGTMTNGYLCTYTTSGTLLSCNTDPASLGGGAGDLKADGTVAMTAALIPNAANTIALGSTSAEWADIYLGDGAIIYGQNDQSNTITSSATGWSFAKPITIADVSNDNYIKITNNSGGRAPTASVYEIYPDAGVWKVNTNGTENTVAIGPIAEQISFSGTLTNGKACTYATGGGISCNSDLVGDGDVTGTGDCTGGACYDGSPDGGTYIRLYDGTSAYESITGGVRLFTFSSSTADSENLTVTLGNNDNTVSLSSSTGVTKIDYGAIGFGTTGTISGGTLTPVIGDADDFDNNFTGANLYGGTYIVNAAGTIILPNATAGMNFTIVLESAAATLIEPLATVTEDTIVMNGLAAAQGEYIESSTVGAMCVFQYRAADSWMATCNGFVEDTVP